MPLSHLPYSRTTQLCLESKEIELLGNVGIVQRIGPLEINANKCRELEIR
jgi:hypothetical protein